MKWKNKVSIFYAIVIFLLICCFQIIKNNSETMTRLTDATTIFKQNLALLCSFFPFSLTEWLYVLAFILIVMFIFRSIRAIKGAECRKMLILYKGLFVINVFGTVFLLMFLLWGANYYAQDIETKIGIYAKPSSVELLAETTKYFAQQASSASMGVQRDEQLLFAADIDEIFEESAEIYTNLSVEFPVLAGKQIAAKPMFFSKIMSVISYSGFFFPFTGEANINIDAPSSMIPVTIAHELAHQRGIASEDEANFAAILACVSSDYPEYVYSGYLLGFIHLGNALNKLDNQRYRDIYSQLSNEVKVDLAYNSQYWQQYQSVISDSTDKLYDSFLKSYGEESGIKSYGEVVDLLIARYQDSFDLAQSNDY